MLGDSAYGVLDWHDPCGQQVVVPIASYNPRNTDNPKDIEYRIEDRITEHSEDVQLKQPILEESNEPTTRSRTAASGTSSPEAASTHEQKYSLRSAYGSSLSSPTTSEETTQAVRFYKMDSMTRSGHPSERRSYLFARVRLPIRPAPYTD